MSEKKKGGRLYKLKIKSKRMEASMASLEPGAESDIFTHEGEELHLLIKGTIIYEVGDEQFVMEEGDILWHESSIPHRAKNPYAHEAAYITVGSPPTFI